MNRRLTRMLVGIVAAIVVLAVVAFAFVVTGSSRSAAGASAARPAIPPIVHPASGNMAACVRCHAQGREGTRLGHGSFGAATCLTCHRVAPVAPGRATEVPGEEAAAVPHGVAVPYDDCVGCHAIGGNRSMPAGHEDFANGNCTDCHTVPAKQ